MENKKLIIFVFILLILSVTYIAYDFGSEYLQQERQDYYNLGRDVGILEWNQEVITTVNDEGNLPYYYFSNRTNETLRTQISLLNLCENFK